MQKLHKAWKVCIGCSILIFCTSGLCVNAFSIYLPYILSYNNFTNTQISMLITARSFSAFVAMFLTGIFYEHVDLRKGMAMAGYLVAGSFLLYGLAKSYPMYFLSAIITGIGYGFGTMVPIGIMLNRWFRSDLSLATGICACVTGLSTLGLPSLIALSIEKNGLSETFIIESIIIVILITICYFLISSSPAKANCEPYYNSKSKNKSVSAKQLSNYNPVMNGKAWIILVPMMLLIGGVTNTAYSHLSVFMTSTGIDTHSTSIVILASGLAVTSSKFIYGWVSNKLSAYHSNWIFGSLIIAGLIACQFTAGNALTMGISIVIYSMGLGMTTVGLVVWVHELSKLEDFDKNNRRMQIGYAAGGLVFSSVPGIIADHNNGSYMNAILMFTVCAVLILVAIQFIYSKGKKKKT